MFIHPLYPGNYVYIPLLLHSWVIICNVHHPLYPGNYLYTLLLLYSWVIICNGHPSSISW